MITTSGKSHIKRYLAQYVPSIAGAMTVGIGTRTENGNDFGLQYEIARVPITLITYDFATNQIIYKGTLPPELVATVNEVGLYSAFQNTGAGAYGTKTITDINDGEAWVQTGTTTGSVFSTTGARIGINGLSQTPAASATRNDSLTSIGLDMSGYSGADIITVAANFANNNASTAHVYFKTDSSNHYRFTLPSVTTGYKITDFVKAGATITGTPDWSNITEIQFTSVSGAGGASAVTWDGIMVQDTDTENLDYTLVARKVLPSSMIKIANKTQDIEFALDVTV